jgi:hypothetical protein
MAEEVRSEKQSSIEVSENAKRQFAFKVKLYYDEEETTSKAVVDETGNIIEMLHNKFGI